MGTRRPRYVNVVRHVRTVRPDIVDPIAAIESRILMVDGCIVTSASSLVSERAPVVLRRARPLRAEDKLRAALGAFAIEVTGRICLDVGAAAGGFTRVLLEHGAAKVLAVDAGFGQLRGSLRTHSRVVNMERTNLSVLDRVVPRCWEIELVTLDLSYLSVAAAVPQLEAVRLASDADLVALVKPMYELGLATAPTDERSVTRTVAGARRGIERGRRWRVAGAMPSPTRGARGAREWLVHACRVGR